MKRSPVQRVNTMALGEALLYALTKRLYLRNLGQSEEMTQALANAMRMPTIAGSVSPRCSPPQNAMALK